MTITEILDPTTWLTANGGPRYIQLQRQLESSIKSGQLPPGTPLPSEREMASITTLSRVTVRKAVQPLVETGLIAQRRGSGTVVADNVITVEQSVSRLTSFSEDMARREMVASSVWLERGVFLPSPQETMALGLSATESVARLSRIRCADNTPMAIERASLPLKILPNPLIVEKSLYEALAATGNSPVRAVQRISAINVKAQDAELLELDEGAAGLKVERLSFLAGGQVVELTRTTYRGDAYDFVAELQLPANTEELT